jgi:hypothetical protein
MHSAILRPLRIGISVLLLGNILSAQTPPAPRIEFPAPSPAATVKQRVGTTDIEIAYSRPSLKGRVMIGQVEPYGKVWRTGANSATTITFSKDVKLGGQNVPAGKYALFTIPGEDAWTIIVNKGAAQWGAFAYDESADIARFTVRPVPLHEAVETFEIGINDIRDGSATINLSWGRVRVPIPLTLDLTPLLQQIDAAMAGDGRKPYVPAAGFYLDNNLDLRKALAWVEAAIAEKADQTNVHLKARILARMGDKPGAIAAARQSIELASRSANAGLKTEYTKMNENLIASLR